MTDMRSPKARVQGLGASGEGTTHFWRQRLTAIANLPLAILFAASLALCGGTDFETARNWFSWPPAAALTLLFLLNTLIHMRLGLQIVIEDYIHNPPLRLAALLANNALAILAGAAGSLSLLLLVTG